MPLLNKLALVFALVALTACADTRMRSEAPKTLYQRLGGYDAIAAVTDDFLGKLAGDARFNRFFAGASPEVKKRLAQLVTEQLCQASGGPCTYIGRPMRAAHTGLAITEAEWTAAATHLVASLDKFKVGAAEKNDVVAYVTSVKPDIVGR